MLTAHAVGIGELAQELKGHAIVVRNPNGDPIVLVVISSPVTQLVYSIDRPDEFNAALKKYGISPAAISTFKV